MKVAPTPRELALGATPVCAAIGVFDGLHLGHQTIIRQTLAEARASGGSAVVITFDKHPNAIVAPQHAPPFIYSLPKKLQVLESLGVDALLLLRFDEALSRKPAPDFMHELARDLGRLRSLCVGGDFTFGYRRGGNLELLNQLGGELGFQTYGLPAVSVAGVTVSSTRIRDAIRAGNLVLASQWLGRPYSLEGKVVTGDRIGGQIGFPTANLDTTHLVLPPHGVYAAHARVNGRAYPAVVNIGLRPTLNSPTPRLQVEAHLLDVTLDLYGARLEVVFKAHLRSEERFHSLDELKAQIARDIAAAKAVL